MPHLTVVDTPDAALRERARKEVEDGLPVRAVAREAALWVHDDDGGWRQLAVFPLAPPDHD